MYADASYTDRTYADIQTIVGFADQSLDATATFKYVIYAGTSEFATRPDDSVAPSRPFRGTLETVLSFRRSIVGSDIGTFTTGDGSSVLNNSDGAYDDLPAVFTADGRPFEIKAHRRGDDYATAYTVFKGVMASWFVDETQVAIQIRDFGYKLNVPAQPNLYAGTGGIEGGDDLIGKRKPIGVGRPRNVSAVPLSASSLQVYQVHDGEIVDVTAVYDRGAALTKGADYPNYAALVAVATTPNTFATCKALGLFRLLGSPPNGQVTADFTTSVDTTTEAVKFYLFHATDLGEADLYEPSFDEVDADQSAPIDYWLGLDDNQTVADVAANLARGIGGWAGFRRNGQFEIRRFAPPSGMAIDSIDRIDLIELKRSPLPSAYSPPPARRRVAYARNWTVQTDLAGGVTDERKSFAGQPYKLASTSDADATSIRADHPFAQDPEPEQTFFRDQAAAQIEAQRLLDRDRVERALYRATVPRRALYWNLGDEITVTYPRWDLTLGRDLVVVELNENIVSGNLDTVEAIFYG